MAGYFPPSWNLDPTDLELRRDLREQFNYSGIDSLMFSGYNRAPDSNVSGALVAHKYPVLVWFPQFRPGVFLPVVVGHMEHHGVSSRLVLQ